MHLAIERARDPAIYAQFCDLVLEYEASLPVDLRHAPDDAENAAFVALADGAPAGCVALATFDAATSVMKRLYVPARGGLRTVPGTWL